MPDRNDMHSNLSRRQTFRVCASILGLPTLGGCLSSLESSPDAGSLIIRNGDSVDHTVTITVTQVSNDDDNFEEFGQTPDPKHTPLWNHEEEFTVAAGEETTQANFITEPGAYYIDIDLDNGEQGNDWIELVNASGELAEDYIYVDINEDGSVDVFSTHQD